jgi:hypothetical protein
MVFPVSLNQSELKSDIAPASPNEIGWAVMFALTNNKRIAVFKNTT